MGRIICATLVLATMACGLAAGGRVAMAAETVVGQPAPEFQLPDVGGAARSLAEFKDAKVVVVVFLGTECPLARLYAPRLTKLAAEYADKGVRFVGIDSNVQDTPEEISKFASEHEIAFPILKDAGNMVADQFHAARTPEVFVLDADRKVRYQGRIDGQLRPGLQKTETPRRDLAVAIDELLAGKPVSEPQLEAVGCHIGRVPKPAAGEVNYSQHIARIFQNRCVECHRAGEIGPFALTSYEESLGWGETIREVVNQDRMPPWFADPKVGHFENEARLSPEEKTQISQWVDAGCPQGDPKDLPEPRKYLDGWNIPQPDAVFKMADKPYQVPAEGVVDYQHFVIDPGFKQDMWMTGCEARPGNRAVVHHILVFLQTPGGQLDLLRGSLLAAYAPGSPAKIAPEGMAVRIPAGSKIIMQLHYTPNGKPQEDISSVGFVFCEEKDVKQRVESGWAVNFAFAIPPGMKDYKITSKHVFEDDRLLLSVTPHMHMRGTSFVYEARYPDGTRETLLNVPRWDFNWQLDYVFTEPKRMPKGTVLHCEAHYDNSADSPTNPDPTKWVRFGEQTWDEMMIGWFTTATLPGQLATAPQSPAKTQR